MRVLVELWIRKDRHSEYLSFEQQAIEIMKSYGGILLGTLCPDAPEHCDEIHLLQFPDRSAFDRYRADPNLAALADLRTSAIQKTRIQTGLPSPLEHDPS